MLNTIAYSIYYPGGNTTALVEGINFNRQEMKVINNRIMENEPSVEQVGFYSTEGGLELQMAGGEFCGNAARSVAMSQYNGQPYKMKLRVSGVTQPIEVGVDATGAAWSEIPIEAGDKPVRKLSESTYLIALEGITQVVVLVPNLTNIRSDAPDQFRRDAYQLLERLGLTKSVPAAGVIYVDNSTQVSRIVPVVWVRAIETLFVETACGSGTMAFALQQAYKSNRSLAIEVKQPSGDVITADVVINRGRVTKARIKGAVKLLRKEVLRVE